MNRQTVRTITCRAVPSLIAACAVVAPYAAIQAAVASDQPASTESDGDASPTALAIPVSGVTGELSGRAPRPPAPRPRGGGSSGYVWGVAEADPTWREQLGDFGDRMGEWFPSQETQLERQQAAEEQQRRAHAAQRAAEEDAAYQRRKPAIDQCRREVDQRHGSWDEYVACRDAGRWVQG